MCNTDVHERLRQARERHGLTLQTIARQSGVREQNLAVIDRGAFDELPTGLFGRNAVRNYATAVGLPAEDILAEVAHFLREPEDPLEGLARVRGISRRPDRKATERTERVAAVTVPATGDAWRVRIAGAIDGALLAGVNLVLLVLTALAAGVPIVEVARVGAPALFLLFVLIFILCSWCSAAYATPRSVRA
jgi:transcriptional regulator with XRE-family HTH domain